jgi:hypothetical protein
MLSKSPGFFVLPFGQVVTTKAQHQCGIKDPGLDCVGLEGLT